MATKIPLSPILKDIGSKVARTLLTTGENVGVYVSALQCCCSNSYSTCQMYTDGNCDDTGTLDATTHTETKKGYDGCGVIAYGTYPGMIACSVLFAVSALIILYNAKKIFRTGDASAGSDLPMTKI